MVAMNKMVLASMSSALALLAVGSAAAQGEPASILQVECLQTACDIRGPGRPTPFMRGVLPPRDFSYRLNEDSIETDPGGRMQVRFSSPQIPKTRELVNSLGETSFRVQETTRGQTQALVVLLARGTIKVVKEGDRAVSVRAGDLAEVVLLGTTVIVFYDPVLGIVEVLVVDGTAQVQNPAVGGPVVVATGGKARVESGLPAQPQGLASAAEIAAANESFEVIGDLGGQAVADEKGLPLHDRAPLDPRGPPGDPGVGGGANLPCPQPCSVIEAVRLGINF